MKAMGKISHKWSPEFAYGLGLITSDGNLSPDNRHISFSTKDEELARLFCECRGIQTKITRYARGGETTKKYHRVQFGDVLLYKHLLGIGLLPRKSKILKKVDVPNEFFPDFLRGVFDGDGNVSAVSHPESSHMQLRVRFYSTSPLFLDWMKEKINELTKVSGGWIYADKRVGALTFAKSDARILLQYMYYSSVIHRLTRKYESAIKYMGE